MTIHPHDVPANDPEVSASLVFSGGIGLGSYQAGACDALLSRPNARIGWIAGSSIAVLNGAMWSMAIIDPASGPAVYIPLVVT